MSLEGKHALVTGSSRGIGRGIALKLAEKGARVAVHYFKNEAAAKDTLARVREHGSDGFILQADVSRPEEIGRIFKKVQAEFGKLDHGSGHRRGWRGVTDGHRLPAGDTTWIASQLPSRRSPNSTDPV